MVVSAIVYRVLGPDAFALLMMVRTTIGLLNYTALGVGPAMVRLAAEARHHPAIGRAQIGTSVLEYESVELPDPLHVVWSNGLIAAVFCGGIGLGITALYAAGFHVFFAVSPALVNHAVVVAAFVGAGTVFRLIGDAPGAILQTSGRIALDNILGAAGELFWVLLSVLYLRVDQSIDGIAAAYMNSGLVLLVCRWVIAGRIGGGLIPRRRLIDRGVFRQIFTFGLLIVVAQLADYLYAPTDYILINRLIDARAVAAYAPLVQIDGGLLVLVTALAAVLLPKTALAHAGGNRAAVRAYYLRGTLFSFIILAAAAAVVWLFSGQILHLWLGHPMPETQAILPLVLIHTVIGGSSAVGRSILLATGRVKPFTVSVLLAGATNVALSYAFVRFCNWGLRGIVLGTIVAVVLRCAIWMPWYVMRSLRSAAVVDIEPLPAAPVI